MQTQKISHGAVHTIPEDLLGALKKDESVIERWEDLTTLARNEWICWVVTNKRPETRSNHIQRTVTELLAGKRRPCCWSGCPHRKSAK